MTISKATSSDSIKHFSKIAARWCTGGVVIGSILACSSLDCGRKAAKVVPAIEKIKPEYGTEPIQCEEPISTPAAKGCVVGSLTCGDSVEGNTAGGVSNWGDDFYQKAFCTPQRHDYDLSPEVVYALEIPADVQAEVRLDSDCADLDVVAVGWANTKKCPSVANSNRIGECEMNTDSGGGYMTLTTVGKPQTFLLGVDGKDGETGNFRLSVKCMTYR